MTIIEFLKARLDEDEADARAATPGPWRAVDADEYGAEVYTATGEAVAASREGGGVGLEDAVHIARHDPDRVLREIEAKRALVRVHPFEPYADEPAEGVCAECQRGGSAGVWPCPTVRIMSAVYADHPDYRQEWAP